MGGNETLDKTYVALIGGELEHRHAVQSQHALKLRPGDMVATYEVTRGDTAREEAIRGFLATDYDRILLLDSDQHFHNHTLERLRAHDLDVVCGLYFRRTVPLIPVAYYPSNEWPLCPMWVYPRAALVQIGAHGFGCVLIKRRVLELIKDTLKPEEPFIWNGPCPELRGDYRSVGADLRFYAHLCKRVGIKSYMDTSVKSGHYYRMMLTEKEYENQGSWLPHAGLIDGIFRERVKHMGEITWEALHLRRQAVVAELEKAKAEASQAKEGLDRLGGKLEELEYLLSQRPESGN